MNLEKVFNIQELLDEKFAENISPDEQNLEIKRIIALLVEIGEFANEVQAFKYWKVNKNLDRVKILEEFADGIHFLSSMSYKKNVDFEISPITLSTDFTIQLSHVYMEASKLFNNLTKEQLKYVYELYLGLGVTAGISEQEILDSFYRKNEINFQRAKNKY
ncbi:dUTP diphosphatase [Mycoplasma phocoenae]|uniref:dUTPase n=1 Tax=Mycoplasma phocoenae TaxID=754517 RepID=A0A858U4P0_9MOLU|nr:dUTP diphosphatase [Mycoplasma phocoenae]QJG67011.1 hypothetical protein HGG69_01590 [Mycoplasma phocoenae]